MNPHTYLVHLILPCPALTEVEGAEVGTPQPNQFLYPVKKSQQKFKFLSTCSVLFSTLTWPAVAVKRWRVAVVAGVGARNEPWNFFELDFNNNLLNLMCAQGIQIMPIPAVYLFTAGESLNAITRATTSGVQDCKGVCPFLFCVRMLAPSWMRKQATVAVAWGPTSPGRPKLSRTCDT